MGTHHDGMADELARSRVVGYGCGSIANTTTYAIATVLLLSYYTDVAGIGAAVIGTVLLIVRVADAGFDLVAGRVVDVTRTRWGKFRPFLLAAGIPLGLLNIVVFMVPAVSPGAEIGYVAISFTLYGLAYSFTNIPYGSLASAMTQEPTQRNRLARAQSMAEIVVYTILYAAITPSLKGTGGGGSGYLIVAIGAGVLSTTCCVAAFALTREVVDRHIPRISLRQSLDAVRANRPMVVLGVSTLCLTTVFQLFSTSIIFYAHYLAGGVGTFVVLSIPAALAQGLFSWLTPVIAHRLGKRETFLAFGVVAPAGYLLLFAAPPALLWLVVVAIFVAASGTAVLLCLTLSLQADTVDYGEWCTGRRTEGTIYALYSVARKVGQAFAVGIAGLVLSTSGYVANQPIQPTSAAWGIRAMVGLIPALGFLITVVCMLAYELTDHRFRDVVTEITDRRKALSRA